MRLPSLLLSACLYLCASALAAGEPEVLRVDLRDRPPEMWGVDGRAVGPLVTVLETAAQRVGARIEWRYTPFARSLVDLREGRVDLVPRVLFTTERETFIHFLPSIGNQARDVLFVVRPGQEQSLRSYDDLLQLRVGVKRGTTYFEPFDADPRIAKEPARDDENLAQMFRAQRFEAIAVLDRDALETTFGLMGFRDFSYAQYRQPIIIENRFGASRKLYEQGRGELYDKLGRELAGMRERGEVTAIYAAQQVSAPQP